MLCFSLLLFLIFSIIFRISLAIECFNCESDFHGALRCQAPCSGERCVVWKWNHRAELRIKQGCISGVDTKYTAKIGCRTNHVGASLCVCNDSPRCNRIERADKPTELLPQIRLPAAECSSRISNSHGPRREKICTSNYCHVTKTETIVDLEQEQKDFSEVLNCGDISQFDFDVRLKNTIGFPGLYPNGCYRLQFDKKVSHTDCFCSTNHCNEQKAAIVPGHVRCYVGNMFRNTSQVHANAFCDGDFCVIQKRGHEVWKGCISVNERDSWSHLKIGHRQILSTEQWICNSHLCNFDLERVKTTNRARQKSKKIRNSSKHFSNLVTLVLAILISK